MSKPMLPVLTHLQFLVLGVLRNDPQPGRTLRKALSGYGIRRTGPAFYQLMARISFDVRAAVANATMVSTSRLIGGAVQLVGD